MEPKNLKSDKVKGYKVYYRNREEFKKICREIFGRQAYKFSTTNKEPFIIDCGSHIGLSILYFKSLYPKARIIGFEPNPENFEILQKNIKTNKLKDVKLIKAAVSDKNGEAHLHVSLNNDEPWTWGDTIVYNMWGDKSEDNNIPVKTVRLSTFITSPVDFIKIDVEGSERAVVEEIEPKLHLVKAIVMEYHLTETGKIVNKYSEIKNIFERNGFLIKSEGQNLRTIIKNFFIGLQGWAPVFIVRATKV